jgi:hypothetical protein
MANEDPLDQLSTAELHDLAVRRARRHLDARFFWRLMQVLPVAEAGAGDLREAEADVATLRAHIDDVTDSGRGEAGQVSRLDTGGLAVGPLAVSPEQVVQLA